MFVEFCSKNIHSKKAVNTHTHFFTELLTFVLLLHLIKKASKSPNELDSLEWKINVTWIFIVLFMLCEPGGSTYTTNWH